MLSVLFSECFNPVSHSIGPLNSLINPKWVGEMAQQIRAMSALPEHSPIPRSYLMAHNHLYSTFRRSDPLSCLLWVPGIQVVHNTHGTYTHKIFKKINTKV